MNQFNFEDQKTKISPMLLAQVQYLALSSEPKDLSRGSIQGRYIAKQQLLRTIRRLRQVLPRH
jgi:hypothetical protein